MTMKKSSLAERAMLVDLSTSFWEGRKKDNRTTEKTISDADAADDAGVFWTRIIPPESLKRLQSALSRGRNMHKELTLPWNDSGVRILPAAMYMQYTQAMRDARAKFDAEVETFLQDYPLIKEQAQLRLGKLYKAEWFPDRAEIRSKFRWHVMIYPLPTAADFRVDLGDENTKQIREDIEAQVKDTVRQATGTLWEKLYTVIDKVVERLSDPEKVFKDSLIGNVVEMVDLLPKLNVTDDTHLEEMRREVAKRLAGLKPGELREDKEQRQKAADTASTILEKMKAFMPTKEV